jgi:hypothetical protein
MAFVKGQSGNPSGRPKEKNEVKELAREHTEEAVARLVMWMRSDNPKASPAAATALLDRAWGRAAQSLEIEDVTVRTPEQIYSRLTAILAFAIEGGSSGPDRGIGSGAPGDEAIPALPGNGAVEA